MTEIERLHQLSQTMSLPEIHARLIDTNEINVALPTLRSWFYQQRNPDCQNRQKLKRALAKIKARARYTVAIRVCAGDPSGVSVMGMQDGILVVFDQEIVIANRQLIKASNPRLFQNLHTLLSKYVDHWLKISP